MTSRGFLSVALHAYPREVRLSRGAEMLDTVLDVSKGSTWVLLRESLALARGGFYTRARLTAAVGGRRILADAVALASTIWMLMSLLSTLRLVSDTDWQPDKGELGYLVLVGIAFAFAILRYDRIAGLCGLAWMIFLFEVVGGGGWRLGAHLVAPPLEVHEILVLLVPFTGYLVMLLAPRSRSRARRDVLRLVGAVALLVLGPSIPELGVGLPTLLLLAVSCAGLLLLPADPRLAIACGLVLTGAEVARWTATSHAVTSTPITWLLATGPLVLAASVLRLRSARRQSSG